MKRLFIFALLSLLITSAFAEIEFYGSARMGYWYEMLDEDLAGGESRMDMQFINYGTSRLGANFTHDSIIGKAEFGFSTAGKVYTRLLYGKFIINDEGCNVIIGQDYSGFNLANVATQSTSIVLDYENMLLGYGALYDGRHPMIKFTNKLGLYLSLAAPKKIDALNIDLPDDDIDPIDALIPKINLGFNYKQEKLGIYPTIGINMSKYNEDIAGIDETVMAYVFATTFKYNMNDLTLQCQVHYGQNIADYGITTSTCANADWDAVEEEIINVVTMGGYLQLTYPIGSTKITAGGGYVISSSDGLNDDDTGMSAFLQGNLKLHKNLSFIPEAGIIDDMEDGMGMTEGSEIYFGTKLQMDF